MSKSTRPNIVLLIVDCLRSDYCPEQGKTELKAWKRLRDTGTCFTHLVSTASTTPVCFAGLLTGLYPFANGIDTMWGKSLGTSTATLTESLQQQGYRTNAFMTGPMLEAYGMQRGFERYEHRHRDDTVYTDKGRAFMQELVHVHEQPGPSFTVVHFFEVHRPRRLGNTPKPQNPYERYKLAWKQLDGFLDELIKQLPSNTLIALSADHGESIVRRADESLLGHAGRKLREKMNLPRSIDDFKSHGYYVYDELVRIPFVLSGPGLKNGVVRDKVVRQIDILPTLMDAAGLTVPEGIHGRSLRGYWQQEVMEDVPAYIQSGWHDCPERSWHALRDERWKYVERPRRGPAVQSDARLYDMAQDLQEKDNVIAEHPEIAREMRLKIDELIYDSGEMPDDHQGDMTDEEKQIMEKQLTDLGYM